MATCRRAFLSWNLRWPPKPPASMRSAVGSMWAAAWNGDMHTSIGATVGHEPQPDCQYGICQRASFCQQKWPSNSQWNLHARCSYLAGAPSRKLPFSTLQPQSTTTAPEPTKCWSCGHSSSDNRGFLICSSCNAIQPLDPTITYFKIFDQEEKFELDLKEVEAKFKGLMKKLHPDLLHGKSTEERENSAQVSAYVTAAYNELLRPVSRATYLLKLRGIHVEEEGTVTDSELLMEVMEIREALQSSPNRNTLQELHDTATARMNKWSRAFSTSLKEGKDTEAVGALQRMSYFSRVCDDIRRELL